MRRWQHLGSLSPLKELLGRAEVNGWAGPIDFSERTLNTENSKAKGPAWREPSGVRDCL